MRVLVTTLTTLALTAAACSGSDEASPITLVTYESFPTDGTRVNELLEQFDRGVGDRRRDPRRRGHRDHALQGRAHRRKSRR